MNESGTPIGFVELPGTVGVHYQVVYPEFDATISMTANFYSVPDNQLVYSETFTANKGYGVPLDGTSYYYCVIKVMAHVHADHQCDDRSFACIPDNTGADEQALR